MGTRLTRLAPQSCSQCLHLRIRLRAKLLAQQRRVRARVLKRAGTITGRLERGHETACDTRTVRLVRREPPPHRDRARHVTRRLTLMCRLLECFREPARQQRTLAIHPTLEIGSVVDMKSVEQRTSVERDRTIVIACR